MPDISPNCVILFFLSFIDDEGRSWRRELAKRCRSEYRECRFDVRGKPLGRVCGSDNKTYKDICRMMKVACERRKQIDLIYDGSCKRRNKAPNKGITSGKDTNLL